ncbi:kinase-like protein, partial [Gonapodya prolifera JEL478]
HYHILPLLGASWDCEEPFMFSERMRNGKILQFLKKNPNADVLGLLFDIASGVYLHNERNVIHADIKALNVLISEKGNAVLTDFGFAKVVEGAVREGSTGHRPGTAIYMAPERLSGSGGTKEIDIYALGVTFHRVSDWPA